MVAIAGTSNAEAGGHDVTRSGGDSQGGSLSIQPDELIDHKIPIVDSDVNESTTVVPPEHARAGSYGHDGGGDRSTNM